MTRPAGWQLRRGGGLVLPLLLAGCAATGPSVPLLGSYFPLWLMASALGVLGAVALRILFVRSGLDDFIPAAGLVYLCAAILLSVVIWAAWSGEFAYGI